MQCGILQVTCSVQAKLAPFMRMQGVANRTSKILGLVNFSSDLEISPTAFAKSLVYAASISFSKSGMFGLGLGFSNKGLGVSDFTIRHPQCISTKSLIALRTTNLNLDTLVVGSDIHDLINFTAFSRSHCHGTLLCVGGNCTKY